MDSPQIRSGDRLLNGDASKGLIQLYPLLFGAFSNEGPPLLLLRCGRDPIILAAHFRWGLQVGRAFVVGGGLAGVTIAYELLSRGYETTVLERRSGVALETSFANGALLTPSMADPWNAPGVHRRLATSLFDGRSAMKVRVAAIPSLAGWGWKFLRYSTALRHEAATRANFALAKYSLACMGELRAKLSLRYDYARVGTLKIFRTAAAMEQSLALATKLGSMGLRFDVLDGKKAAAAEPALAPICDRIAGALRFPDDESGDAQQFCERLTAAFVAAGGSVRFGVGINSIEVERGSVVGVCIGDRVEPVDTVVVAAGNGSVRLLRPMGIALPIRPAKGYTLTFDAEHIADRLRLPIIDDALHAAIVPIGTRIRVAGTAEFAGNSLRIPQKRIDNLHELLAAVLPQVAQCLPRSSGQPWAGLRPMSADGVPFIGLTHVRGLYINTGHGHLGWTLATGSARLLADLIDDRRSDIDPAPYRPNR